MYKPYFSWRKHAIFLFLLVAVVIYSCRKDSDSSFVTQTDTALSDAQLIAEAKTYFESSQGKFDSVKLRTSNSASTPRQHQGKRIDWSKAYIGRLQMGKMVMVPLRYDSTLTITYRGNTWKLNKIARAFIFKDKTGTMRTQVVIRIPESYSMEQEPASSFSGLVLVEDWNGNTVKTIRFKNGKTSRMGIPVPVNDKKVLAYKTTTVICEGFSWGHCAWNGSTGEFQGCWEEGFEEVCYNGPGGVNPYEQEDEDYGGGGSYDGSGSGGNQTPPPPPPVVIIVDSLKSKYPCAVNLILDKLLFMQSYATFVEPFCGTQKPDLFWDAKRLPWNQSNGDGTNTYQLGEEVASPTSRLGLSRDIYLNASALDNSSQLLIAAAVIHETLHAYIGYNISIADNNVQNNYNDYGTWFGALDAFYSIRNLPPNYSGHYQMLTDYFNKATGILSSWDNNSHTQKEYAMAMLYGLNTTDPNCPPDVKARLNSIFTSVMATYNITASDLNAFNINNLNATSSKKLPTTGCD